MQNKDYITTRIFFNSGKMIYKYLKKKINDFFGQTNSLFIRFNNH